MTNCEGLNAGNFFMGEIYEPTREIGINGRMVEMPSLAELWRQQGITFIEHDPFPTIKYSGAELALMGIVGVTLMVPKPENTED